MKIDSPQDCSSLSRFQPRKQGARCVDLAEFHNDRPTSTSSPEQKRSATFLLPRVSQVAYNAQDVLLTSNILKNTLLVNVNPQSEHALDRNQGFSGGSPAVVRQRRGIR